MYTVYGDNGSQSLIILTPRDTSRLINNMLGKVIKLLATKSVWASPSITTNTRPKETITLIKSQYKFKNKRERKKSCLDSTINWHAGLVLCENVLQRGGNLEPRSEENLMQCTNAGAHITIRRELGNLWSNSVYKSRLKGENLEPRSKL